MQLQTKSAMKLWRHWKRVIFGKQTQNPDNSFKTHAGFLKKGYPRYLLFEHSFNSFLLVLFLYKRKSLVALRASNSKTKRTAMREMVFPSQLTFPSQLKGLNVCTFDICKCKCNLQIAIGHFNTSIHCPNMVKWSLISVTYTWQISCRRNARVIMLLGLSKKCPSYNLGSVFYVQSQIAVAL
jgi:hypothetical protein